jgi:predicted anti-sigma-YlaC factor YlaD
MNCKEIHNRLNAYLESSLDESQLSDFNMHLSACPSCQKAVEEVKLTYALLESPKKIEADPFMHTRIMASLEDQAETKRWRFRQILQPVMVSLLIITGVYLGIGLGNRFYDEDVLNASQDNKITIQEVDVNSYASIASEIESFLLTEE